MFDEGDNANDSVRTLVQALQIPFVYVPGWNPDEAPDDEEQMKLIVDAGRQSMVNKAQEEISELEKKLVSAKRHMRLLVAGE